MITTRTRSGFFYQSPKGNSVWVAYAGTTEDVLLTMSNEQLEAALARGEHRKAQKLSSYGIGVLKEIDEIEQLYVLEAVYNGYHVMPVFTRSILTSMARHNTADVEETNNDLYATKEG